MVSQTSGITTPLRRESTFGLTIRQLPLTICSGLGKLDNPRLSDRAEIVECSGFLNPPPPPSSKGDSIMADKGFTIEDIFLLGISLNTPLFLGMSDQMSAEYVVKTQDIVSLRIHVERATNKVKNFSIFEGVIPLSQFGIVNQMWCVCVPFCVICKIL